MINSTILYRSLAIDLDQKQSDEVAKVFGTLKDNKQSLNIARGNSSSALNQFRYTVTLQSSELNKADGYFKSLTSR